MLLAPAFQSQIIPFGVISSVSYLFLELVMVRKRVTASEKKQRHELRVRQIDAGMDLSESTAFAAEI